MDGPLSESRPPMLSREERTPFSEWWWTVDKPLMGAISTLR